MVRLDEVLSKGGVMTQSTLQVSDETTAMAVALKNFRDSAVDLTPDFVRSELMDVCIAQCSGKDVLPPPLREVFERAGTQSIDFSLDCLERAFRASGLSTD